MGYGHSVSNRGVGHLLPATGCSQTSSARGHRELLPPFGASGVWWLRVRRLPASIHFRSLTSHSIIYIGKVARELLQDSVVLDPIAGSMAYVLGIFISLLMWSFGLIWLVFALATVLYSSPFPFNMGWWGFTFPLGVYAANTMELGVELDLMFFKVFGTVSWALSPVFFQANLKPLEDLKHCSVVAMGSRCVPHSSGCLARQSVFCPLSSELEPERR